MPEVTSYTMKYLMKCVLCAGKLKYGVSCVLVYSGYRLKEKAYLVQCKIAT